MSSAGPTPLAGDKFLVDAFHADKVHIICRYWVHRTSTLQVLVPIADLELTPAAKPQARRLSVKAPTFSSQLPVRDVLSMADLDKPSSLHVTASSLTDDQSAQLDVALSRGYWHDDELPLRKLFLEQKAARAPLTTRDALIYSSFALDHVALSAERAASDVRRQEVLDLMTSHDQTLEPNQRRNVSYLGTAASLALPVEVASSQGWSRIYKSTEEAAIELKLRTSSISMGVTHGSMSRPDSQEVFSMRRVPNQLLVGEFAVAEDHALPHKATVFTTAGRIAAGPSGLLHFGKPVVCDVQERRFTGDKQVARAAMLVIDPPPGDPDDFEMDHINNIASDNRWCNLQWLRVRNGPVNQHHAKSAVDRLHARPVI